MAITITSTPPKTYTAYPTGLISVMPVMNNIAYSVSSNNTAKCNFQYIADVYVNGVMVKRLERFPNQSGSAEFKIQTVLQDYLKANPMIDLVGFNTNPERIISYQVKFGEAYDNSVSCNSTISVFPNLTNSEIAYAWKGALQYRESVDYRTTSPYEMSRTKPGKFLTHSPETIMIGMGEQAELSYMVMPGQENVSEFVIIETFDRNGNVLQQYPISNGIGPVSNQNEMIQTIGVGPENINNAFGIPFIDQFTHKYRISLASAISTPLNQNTTMQYLSGVNGWTTDSFPGCGSSFGITVSNQMSFVIPDVSCGDTMTSTYYGSGTFVQGTTYTVTINISAVNNPSGNAFSVTPIIGGVLGTPVTSLGTTTVPVTAGPGGILQLQGYMDADTAGFGSHSFDISLVEVKDATIKRTSEYKYYEIDRRKSRFNPVRFRWLNTLGGYDSYAFNKLTVKTTSIERTEYQKLMPTNYSIGDRGRTNIAITAKDRISVTSNWLTEKEETWMKELFISNDVYVQDVNPIYTFTSMQASDPSFPTNDPIVTLNPYLDSETVDKLQGKSFLGDKSDPSSYAVFNGTKLALEVTQSTITLQIASGANVTDDCGYISLANAQLKEDPIILTSTSFEEKVKANTRNINTTIEFEYAFDLNTHRN